MILLPEAPAVHPALPPRSSKPPPGVIVSQRSLLPNTLNSVFPSSAFSSATHSFSPYRNNRAHVFEHHQHHGKEFRRAGGFENYRGGKGRKEIFGLEIVRVDDEGCSRKPKKKGLKFCFDDESLGGGEVRICDVTLKEGDLLLTKNQQQPSSAGSSAVVVPRAAAASGSSMEGKSLWRKLAQNVNVAGISFTAKVIVKDRHLAIPHVNVPDISWIDWKALRIRGFEGVLFDKDNTLTAPYGQNIWPPLTDSLEECREVFGGRIALLSNSAGLYQYDPLGAEAKTVENRLGIPVVRHGQKKPAGNALAVSHYFGCDPAVLIMVGDRYFTDVVFGNNNGMLTIRPAPLTSRGEPFVVKKVRVLEDTLVDWWRQQGCLPPKHKLFDNPVDFIKDPGCW